VENNKERAGDGAGEFREKSGVNSISVGNCNSSLHAANAVIQVINLPKAVGG
jgi:hypothetical protein